MNKKFKKQEKVTLEVLITTHNGYVIHKDYIENCFNVNFEDLSKIVDPYEENMFFKGLSNNIDEYSNYIGDYDLFDKFIKQGYLSEEDYENDSKELEYIDKNKMPEIWRIKAGLSDYIYLLKITAQNEISYKERKVREDEK